MRFFHPSFGNTCVLPKSTLISDSADLHRFLEGIFDQDFYELVERPNTKWRIVHITNIAFYVNKLSDAPIGRKVELPAYIVNNSGITALNTDDDFCFFRCLSVFRGSDKHDCELDTKQLFQCYIHHFDIDPSSFDGVKLFDFVEIEDLFQINIVVYSLNETSAQLVHRSREVYKDTMKLNLYENHFSLIHDFEKYCNVYRCVKCDQLWYQNMNYLQHIKHCTVKVTQHYPGGVYRNPKTVFEKLQDIGIHIDPKDRFYPYTTVYDFECYFDCQGLPNDTDLLHFQARHEPLGVSVASTVPGHEEPVCFINEGSSGTLIEKFLNYLDRIAKSAFKILQEKFSCVFDDLEKSSNTNSNKIKEEFTQYLQELIILGFNSGSYDLNLIKKQLIEQLADKIKFVIRRSNHYLCIKTPNFKFLGIKNHLAPGFSYRKFLKAYGCDDSKFFFPYEWLDNLSKLETTQIPPHEAFFSHLTQSNISLDEYNLVCDTWKQKNWSTVRDLLIYYNNLDVAPFVQAVENLLNNYKSQNLHLFMQAFSVSGIAKIIMFKEVDSDVFFPLIPKKRKDLDQMFRDQLCGGVSQVFTRKAIKDVTKIRPHQIENPHTCKTVQGLDASALYLYVIYLWYVRIIFYQNFIL